MSKYRSKEDDVNHISISIFVTNFPESFSSKDLFHTCKQYGHVVDSFIPSKRTKEGKRFGFVRFINVFNVDRLVNNLCTIWVGRLKLHANTARFQRKPLNEMNASTKNMGENNRGADKCSRSYGGAMGSGKSYVNVLKSSNVVESPSPALVIDDAFVVRRELDNYVMGEVKLMSSIVNIRTLLSAEGFNNVKPIYMGGLWVLLELDSNDVKEKFMKHVGVASWFNRLCDAEQDFVSRERIAWVDIEGVPLHGFLCEVNILEAFKIIVKRKVFVVRAKELFVWSPVFKEPENVEYCSDTESEKEGVVKDGNDDGGILDAESEVEGVSETNFGDLQDGLDADHVESVKDKECSSDPFSVYSLLNKNKNKADSPQPIVDTSLTHPPGFTPDRNDNASDVQEMRMPDNASPHNHSVGLNSRILQDASLSEDTVVSNGQIKEKGLRNGGSILEVLDDMIKVGQAMGFSMGGCLNDMEGIINSQGGHEGDQ
ncbi:RNA-directed DNA polymerase, eukaryota [Tanacetum coccineum]